MNSNNTKKKGTVSPGIIGGGLNGARPNTIADQIKHKATLEAQNKTEQEAQDQAKAEKEAQDQAKAEQEAQDQAKAEQEAQDQAKAEQEAQAQAKAEQEAQDQAKAEKEAQAQAKAEQEAQAKAEDTKVKADTNQADEQREVSDETKRELKRGAIYRFAGLPNEGRQTQSSFTIDQDLYSQLRMTVNTNNRKMSYKDFFTVMGVAMVNGLIDIDKIQRDLYRKGLIDLKEVK